MENIILLDSSVLIDYFRRVNKSNSFFYKISSVYSGYAISVIVHYEILRGSDQKQIPFWNNLFADFFILPYTPSMNYVAISIGAALRKKRKTIDFKDMIIAATAIQNKLALATLNKKHFENISDLQLITPNSFE